MAKVQKGVGDCSDGELSEEIPYQGSETRVQRMISSSSSSSSASEEHESNDEIQGSRNRRLTNSKRSKRKRRRSTSDQENSLLLEIQKTNKMIASLSKKMKSHGSRLQAIENQLSQTSSVSSGSPVTPKRTTTKRDVPCEVRVS